MPKRRAKKKQHPTTYALISGRQSGEKKCVKKRFLVDKKPCTGTTLFQSTEMTLKVRQPDNICTFMFRGISSLYHLPWARPRSPQSTKRWNSLKISASNSIDIKSDIKIIIEGIQILGS